MSGSSMSSIVLVGIVCLVSSVRSLKDPLDLWELVDPIDLVVPEPLAGGGGSVGVGPLTDDGTLKRVRVINATIEPRHLTSGTGTITSHRVKMYHKRNLLSCDHYGHIIAKQFGGTGDKVYNIFAQNSALNLGLWKTLVENPIRSQLLMDKTVSVFVTLTYPDRTTLRPNSLIVSASSDREHFLTTVVPNPTCPNVTTPEPDTNYNTAKMPVPNVLVQTKNLSTPKPLYYPQPSYNYIPQPSYNYNPQPSYNWNRVEDAVVVGTQVADVGAGATALAVLAAAAMKALPLALLAG